MVKNFGWIFTLLCFAILMLSFAFWPGSKGNVVVVKYDCSVLIGGWHPDVPLKVQEECRKKLKESLK
jgi:hypothetical protein